MNGPCRGALPEAGLDRAARPRRIAMVAACPFPQPRGTPLRVQRMAESLARRGHLVHLVTYHLGSGSVSDRVIVDRIRRVPSYRKTSPGVTYQKLLLLDTLLTSKLARVLRQHRFDVIHAHHYEGLLAAAVARKGTRLPLVYDAHTLLASELRYNRLYLPAGVKRGLGGLLDRHLPRRADHVIAVAEPIRDRLVADGAVSESHVSVVSNGVELDRFDVSGSTTPPGGERNGAERLIFAGNLAAYQRIDLLLEAFRQIHAARPATRLQLVTNSSFDPHEWQARRLGIRDAIDILDVDFERYPAVLAATDVALNPRTECDGIPVKLLNYMAAARPTVSFAGCAPGVRHGETGWLVETKDASAFAQGVLALLADPVAAERIGRNARAHVEKFHDWSRICEQIEDVYDALLRTPTATTAVRSSSP